ncbi:hypothetical protein DY000_02030482 [Brassica cretica]|uniref:GLTSCR protein conserved domain-containing protein n=1 Tax=Brassica cretica TaxID=69181 RepID=A0ABQ7DJK9_BRACR|nr:hypothetical protein DY000_02030482 [Brassica cretica]
MHSQKFFVRRPNFCDLRPKGPKTLRVKKSVGRVKSSSPTGSEGRDRPPKKAKTNDSDHHLGVSGEATVAKPFHWQFSHSKDCPITEDPDSVAHLVRHFKPAGCPLPALRNMTELEAYVKMVVAHAKAMEANNEFAATLEKRLQDVLCSDELYEIKKVVRELKLGLKMAQDQERANAAQLAAAEKLGNQAASLEARLRVRRRAKEIELEFEVDVMANSDFSVGKLDLPQISEDLQEDFFDEVPSAADGVAKCSGDRFKDGEFSIEE